MAAPLLKVFVDEVVQIRHMFFTHKGDFFPGHVHHYEHSTFIPVGKIAVTVEGVRTEYEAPFVITIGKGKVHDLEALEDNTIAACIIPMSILKDLW